MADRFAIQLKLNAPAEAIFTALTTSAALSTWFAEAAEVSLPEKRYDFWGRYSPEAPSREQGYHPILAVKTNQQLSFGWRLRQVDTQVDIQLKPQAAGTVLLLGHQYVPAAPGTDSYSLQDFWFFSLENLRRYLDGKGIVRCDFSAIPPGDVHQTIEIDAPPEAVFAALIEPEQLNRWIASNADIVPNVGNAYDLGWGEGGPLKIIELVPNEKITYTWQAWAQMPETVTTWTLEGTGGKTRLTLIHSGFGPDDQHDMNIGWLHYLSWLKSMVEYGPDWQPPLIRVEPEMVAYHPASVIQAQDQLITESLE